MSPETPRPPDPRREPDADEDITDLYSREELFPPKPKLRLESSKSEPPRASGCGPDESTLIVKPSRISVAGAVMPRTVRAWLEVVSGPTQGVERFPITMLRVVLGRGHQADIRIRDGHLSRKHATIFFTGAEFRIRDENSGNGTLLNGSKVVEYCVRSGDEIVAGTTVLRFRMEQVD